MASMLEAVVAKHEHRVNWEKAIDHLQWCLLNNQRLPSHERALLVEKANILKRHPALANMERMTGFNFHEPFGKWIGQTHWEAVKALAVRLSE